MIIIIHPLCIWNQLDVVPLDNSSKIISENNYLDMLHAAYSLSLFNRIVYQSFVIQNSELAAYR